MPFRQPAYTAGMQKCVSSIGEVIVACSPHCARAIRPAEGMSQCNITACPPARPQRYFFQQPCPAQHTPQLVRFPQRWRCFRLQRVFILHQPSFVAARFSRPRTVPAYACLPPVARFRPPSPSGFHPVECATFVPSDSCHCHTVHP